MLMINWTIKNHNGFEFNPVYVTRRFKTFPGVYRSPLCAKVFLRYKEKRTRVKNGTLKTLWIFPNISRLL